MLVVLSRMTVDELPPSCRGDVWEVTAELKQSEYLPLQIQHWPIRLAIVARHVVKLSQFGLVYQDFW